MQHTWPACRFAGSGDHRRSSIDLASDINRRAKNRLAKHNANARHINLKCHFSYYVKKSKNQEDKSSDRISTGALVTCSKRKTSMQAVAPSPSTKPHQTPLGPILAERLSHSAVVIPTPQ